MPPAAAAGGPPAAIAVGAMPAADRADVPQGDVDDGAGDAVEGAGTGQLSATSAGSASMELMTFLGSLTSERNP